MNSLSSLVQDFTRSTSNYMSVLDSINKLASTSDEEVQIQIVNKDGSITNISVPSIAYLKQEISRLSDNVDNLAGHNTRSASVRLPDGTYTKLYNFGVPSYPPPVTNDLLPTGFSIRSTGVIDQLIDPNLVVRVDVSNHLGITDLGVLVGRMVATPSPDQLPYVEANLAGRLLGVSQISSILQANDVPYTFREFMVNIDAPASQENGYFDVLDYYKKDVTIVAGGIPSTRNRMVYKLNTLTYKKGESDLVLKPGSTIFLTNQDGSRPTTDYVVEFVDSTTNEVAIKIKNGVKPVRKGAAVFGISPSTNRKSIISVPVGPNQVTAIFIKPINSINVTSEDWGKAVVFNTNSLLYDVDGQTTLGQFYEHYANDAAKSMRVASEYGVPLLDGLLPIAPTLSPDDFKVTLINDHMGGKNRVESIRQKASKKSEVMSQIRSLDESISNRDLKIKTFNFTGATERDAIIKGRDEDIGKRKQRVEELESLVRSLATEVRDTTNYTPKYRIRGFWQIPPPKYKDPINQLMPQEVVQFIHRYRYLRKDNTSTSGELFKYVDADGNTQRASFSKWVEVKGKAKVKKYVDGTLSWVEDDTSDPDVNNINQLDIPITRGENVEIQVKSLSEVGYPLSPLESEWSNSIIVEFPEGVEDAEFISTEAEADLSFLNLVAELSRLGLDAHLADANTLGGRYFSHSTDGIATAVKTPENNPIDLTTLLNDYMARIAALEATISGGSGELAVSIVDEAGNLVSNVSNLDTVDLFSGYYVEEVEESATPKGEIISKMYFIRLENVKPVDLKLLSFVPGSYTDQLPAGDAYDGYLHNRYEYVNYRQYDRVPMALRGVVDNDELYSHHTDTDGPFRQLPAYQSSQAKSQYAYCRLRDLTLNNRLYELPASVDDQVLTIKPGAETSAFVWDMSQTPGGGTPSGNGELSTFCVHVDHPYLADGSYFMDNFADLFNANYVPNINLDADESSIVYPPFYHSAYFNLPATAGPDHMKQLAYYQYQKGVSGTDFTFANHPRKIGFVAEDKYLIGKDTVGSYLFVATNPKSISTLSPVYSQGFILKNGDSFVINIPVIFQYRMTDYHGSGSSGTGILGGYGSGSLSNLTFTKKIGIDILVDGSDLFSFDLKCTAKYKPANLADSKKLIRS